MPADGDEIINQTVFKTQRKFAFDSLILSVDILTLLNGYTDVIRPRMYANMFLYVEMVSSYQN